jgi:hypothetical protein
LGEPARQPRFVGRRRTVLQLVAQRPAYGAQGPSTTEDGAYFLDGATTYAALIAVTREPGASWWIPSEDEWYKAAYYDPSLNDEAGGYYDYPTSSDTAPGYVDNSGNLSGTATPFAEGGTDPGNYATYHGASGTDGIGSPYYRTEVGEWENSASPCGTFDQGGNLWEWNEAILYGSYRGLRGGSSCDVAGNLLASNWSYGSLPAQESYYFGFRVASVPEPGSIILLLCGAIAGLMWWRRRK